METAPLPHYTDTAPNCAEDMSPMVPVFTLELIKEQV